MCNEQISKRMRERYKKIKILEDLKMNKIVLTVGLITTFCYCLVSEIESLKTTAADLKSSVIVLEKQNDRLVEILNKDIYIVSKEDYKPFNETSVMIEKEELKKIVLEEIDKESKELEIYYKEFKIESVSQEEIDKAILDLEKEGIIIKLEN